MEEAGAVAACSGNLTRSLTSTGNGSKAIVIVAAEGEGICENDTDEGEDEKGRSNTGSHIGR